MAQPRGGIVIPPMHQGKAPEPQRALDLESGLTTDVAAAPPPPAPTGRTQPTGTDFNPEAVDFGHRQPDNIPMPDSQALLQTPAPEQPELAAELAGLRSQVGDLIRRIGDQNQQHRLSLLDQEANFQAQLAAMRQAPQAPAGPVGPDPRALLLQDPDAPMTHGKFMEVMDAAERQRQAQMVAYQTQQIRSSWGLTPQQESEILARNPGLQYLPEPQKSQTILRYAQVLFPAANPGDGGTPSAGTPATPVPTARPPLPHRESPPIAAAAEPQPGNARNDALSRAYAEYERAKGIPNLAQQARALRIAAEKIYALQGTSLENESKRDFTQT